MLRRCLLYGYQVFNFDVNSAMRSRFVMARPLRIQYEGAFYHVTSRGNAKNSIFLEEDDRLAFLDVLSSVNERYHWLCHAYCLMGNHYHLLIETPEANLALGMRQLNGVYTQHFNKRHGTVGHLFQGRYKAILVQKESHFLEVSRYVVLNPVRGHLVRDPAEWKWSSYRGMAGFDQPHPCLTLEEVLGQWGAKRAMAQKAYREFVRQGIGKESIWDQLKGQSLLGEADFVDRLVGFVRGYEKVKEIPREQRQLGRPHLHELFSKNMLSEKKRRDKRIREAIDRHGYTQREVADHLGMHYSTISRLVNEKRDGMSKSKT
jgi:REP element-mobilizing transposase RayT